MWSRNSESSLDIRLISYVLSWFLGVFFWTTYGVSLNFCWKVEVGYPMITNCFYKFTCGHIAFSRSSRVSCIRNVRMYTCHQNDFFISKKRGRAVRALPKHSICNISTNQPAKHSTSGSPYVPLHGASKLIVCGRRFCLRLSVLTADFMADTANSKTVPPQFWKSGPTLDRQKIA